MRRTAKAIPTGPSASKRPSDGVVREQRLYNVAQTAAYLGRSPVAIREMLRRGKLASVRHDGRVMFDIIDLDRSIESAKSQPRAEASDPGEMAGRR